MVYFPEAIRTSLYQTRKPILTFIFLLTCIIVFIFELIVPLDYFSFTPAYVFERPWTFITSIFLHADLSHLLFNMFALFMFGIYLESRISKKEYILIFFVAGVFGNIGYFITALDSTIPAVGASGAIYGIMGCLAILTPLILVYTGGFPMPMIAAAFFWAAMEFMGIFTPGEIAHQSHVAGLLIGVIFGIQLRRKRSLEHHRS